MKRLFALLLVVSGCHASANAKMIDDFGGSPNVARINRPAPQRALLTGVLVKATIASHALFVTAVIPFG